MSFLSSSVFVCIYFTSSPSFILFTLCVYSTLSIENFSYLLYNNNKNQTWLVPERASVKLCKREQVYGERESTLSLSYRSSRCGVIKLFTWVWPKSIIELILCFLFGAPRSWYIDCSPRNSRFLSVYQTFSRVSSVYEAQKVFLYIHTWIGGLGLTSCFLSGLKLNGICVVENYLVLLLCNLFYAVNQHQQASRNRWETNLTLTLSKVY